MEQQYEDCIATCGALPGEVLPAEVDAGGGKAEEHGSRAGGRLTGKVAVITGASSGPGPVMAQVFVREGARVLLAARREELVRAAADAAG